MEKYYFIKIRKEWANIFFIFLCKIVHLISTILMKTYKNLKLKMLHSRSDSFGLHRQVKIAFQSTNFPLKYSIQLEGWELRSVQPRILNSNKPSKV